HGILLLLKGNIATIHKQGLHALLSSAVTRDALVAAKLREAGSISVVKNNMSKGLVFAVSSQMVSRRRGGQTLSPYY
ncbi:hypothetical protein F5141DRAFT_970619, partial [Pisolithus sp. B1]